MKVNNDCLMKVRHLPVTAIRSSDSLTRQMKKKNTPESVKKIFEKEEEEHEQKESVTSNIQNEQLENMDDEKNKSVESSQNSETERVCFASSLLNKQQNDLLLKLLKVLDIPFSRTVDQNISHLIVNAPDGHFQNTYKVLYAMVLHKKIIRYEWVEDVFKSNRLLSMDPYLVIDESGNCGISRAMKDKDRQLLHEFAIHIYSVDNQIVQKDQIEELIRLSGGLVVPEIHQFHNVRRDLFRIIIVAEGDDTLTQEDWRQKYSALDVVINWIYDTIGYYRVAPLESYITNPTDALLFLHHQGYPENLIFGTPTQA